MIADTIEDSTPAAEPPKAKRKPAKKAKATKKSAKKAAAKPKADRANQKAEVITDHCRNEWLPVFPVVRSPRPAPESLVGSINSYRLLRKGFL